MKKLSTRALAVAIIVLAVSGFAVNAQPPNGKQQIQAGERLLLMEVREYRTGFLGFAQNDTFQLPPGVKKITRTELAVEGEGPLSFGAYVVSAETNSVVVRRYADLFSRLKFVLRVYGE